MNGPDHYRAAERLLRGRPHGEMNLPPSETDVAVAQVHAMLAIAASNLALGGMTDDGEWRRTLELNPVGQPTDSREG